MVPASASSRSECDLQTACLLPSTRATVQCSPLAICAEVADRGHLAFERPFRTSGSPTTDAIELCTEKIACRQAMDPFHDPRPNSKNCRCPFTVASSPTHPRPAHEPTLRMASPAARLGKFQVALLPSVSVCPDPRCRQTPLTTRQRAISCCTHSAHDAPQVIEFKYEPVQSTIGAIAKRAATVAAVLGIPRSPMDHDATATRFSRPSRPHTARELSWSSPAGAKTDQRRCLGDLGPEKSLQNLEAPIHAGEPVEAVKSRSLLCPPPPAICEKSTSLVASVG